MALLEIENLAVEFPTPPRRRSARSTASTSRSTHGEVLGDRRRIGLGQERDDAGGDGPGRRARPRHAPTRWRFDGRDLLDMSDARAARAHRQGHRDDLPGADDEPQSVLHRRLPDRPRRCALHRGLDRKAARAARAIELLEQVGIPDAGAPAAAPFRTSSPAA